MCEINQEPSPFYILSSDRNQKLLPNWEDYNVSVFDLAEGLPQYFDEIISVLESDTRSVKHLSMSSEYGNYNISVVNAKKIVRVNKVGIGFSDAELNPIFLEIPSGYTVIFNSPMAVASDGIRVNLDTQILTILK